MALSAVAEPRRVPLVLAVTACAAVVVSVMLLVRCAGTASPGVLGAWAAAGVLVATVAAAVRRGGWFHPLAFPLAAIAVLSFAAPLWVHVTGQPAGLLYGGSAALPPLAVTMSGRAVEALALVAAGYLAGALASLTLVRQRPVVTAALEACGLRRTGRRLMVCGALAALGAAAASRGTVYGAAQLSYGLPSLLGDVAPAAMLAGLAVVTIPAAGAMRLRDLLRGSEWAALAVYMAALALTGDRGYLIAPAVYVAWVYAVKVRPVRVRWVVATAAVVMVVASVIAGYRAGSGLPASPSAVVAGAAADVSSPAWLTQQTVQRVPSEVPYARGSTYVAAAQAQLPGPLARRTGAVTRTASAVFRSLIGFTDPDQGFSESYPSEAYLNFGLPGCLGAGVVLGAVMGWAWRRQGVLRARGLLYPVLLAGLVYGLRSDAVTQVKDVLYPLVIVALVLAWHRPASGHPVSRQVTRAY